MGCTASNLLSTARVSMPTHAELLWGTYSDRPSVTQGAPPVHIKLPGTFDDVELLDELLVRADQRRLALTGELGSRTEIALSAGNGFLSISRVVAMVTKAFHVVGGFASPDIESLILVIRLSFSFCDRLFQPSWCDDGFPVLR